MCNKCSVLNPKITMILLSEIGDQGAKLKSGFSNNNSTASIFPFEMSFLYVRWFLFGPLSHSPGNPGKPEMKSTDILLDYKQPKKPLLQRSMSKAELKHRDLFETCPQLRTQTA